MIRIFELDEHKKLSINEHTLLVPELKAIIDKFEDPIPPLSYVYLLTVPDSPYANLPEDEKKQSISEDVGGEFSLEDPIIDAAITKLQTLFSTPTSRLFIALQKSIDTISEYLTNASVIEGKDGNLDSIRQYQQNIGKIHESFKKIEKAKDEELKVALRGKARLGLY